MSTGTLGAQVVRGTYNMFVYLFRSWLFKKGLNVYNSCQICNYVAVLTF